MKSFRCSLLVGGLLFVTASAWPADVPPRETVTKDGWTIECSPIDRPAAERLAAQTARLDQIVQQSTATKIELEPSALAARAGEFAQKISELCAMPARQDDLQAELVRLAAGLTELQIVSRQAYFPRAIAIWRKSELIRRLGSGEKIGGFAFDPATKEVSFSAAASFNLDAQYHVAGTGEPLKAIPVKQKEEGPSPESAEGLIDVFRGNVGGLEAMNGWLIRLSVGGGLQMAIRQVLQKEVSKDPAARWIASGTAGWVTRLLILRETSPQVAERYTLAEQQRLASQGKLQQVKLEQWPSDNDGAYVLAAARVFRNIAEKHGNPAVTQVLTAFWRLPPAQRTSKSFRKLYQQLLKEPVEAEAPESTLSP